MANRNAIRNRAAIEQKTERELIEDALNAVGHEQRRVAELLGVSQSAVSEAMKRLKFMRVIRWLPES